MSRNKLYGRKAVMVRRVQNKAGQAIEAGEEVELGTAWRGRFNISAGERWIRGVSPTCFRLIDVREEPTRSRQIEK